MRCGFCHSEIQSNFTVNTYCTGRELKESSNLSSRPTSKQASKLASANSRKVDQLVLVFFFFVFNSILYVCHCGLPTVVSNARAAREHAGDQCGAASTSYTRSLVV